MKVHISNVVFAEQLEELGVSREELANRLQNERPGYPWKKEGDLFILPRHCAKELYPNLARQLEISDGIAPFFGSEWEDFMPLSAVENEGFKESKVRKELDDLPDAGFAIFIGRSQANRFKGKNGFIYAITPAFIEKHLKTKNASR